MAKKTFMEKYAKLREDALQAILDNSTASSGYGQPRPGFLDMREINERLEGEDVVGIIPGHALVKGKNGYAFRVLDNYSTDELCQLADLTAFVKAKPVVCNVFTDDWDAEVSRLLA